MMNGVLDKVSSVIDEHNVRAVAIHPAAARGQYLPPTISVDVVRASIMDYFNAPSRVLGQLSNITPPNQ
jgi:hypothetical protein